MDDTFQAQGFVFTGPLLDTEDCDAIDRELGNLFVEGAGTRSLLNLSWCASLTRRIRSHPSVHSSLPPSYVAVLCTLFEKSLDRNWLVGLHQDLSIPVAEKVNHSDLCGWSEKEGLIYVQAPVSVLSELVAVRMHLDDCGVEDGPLRVVPGSHRFGRLDGKGSSTLREQLGEIACSVPRGGALLIRPLLLHASSKATSGRTRRVLHFLFGPPALPLGLKWGHTV